MRRFATTRTACLTLALLALGLCPAAASAQTEVRAETKRVYDHGAADGGNYFEYFSVRAWLDEQGVAHGAVTYVGDLLQQLPGGSTGYHGGPADPWHIAVTGLTFVGNTAYVDGIVISSPNKSDVGNPVSLSFTDNSGTGDPDLAPCNPIDAGYVRIR